MNDDVKNAYTIVKYIDSLIINNGKNIRDKINSFVEFYKEIDEIIDKESLIYSFTEFDHDAEKPITYTDDFINSLNKILQSGYTDFQQDFKSLYYSKNTQQKDLLVYDICTLLDNMIITCKSLKISQRVKDRLEEHINELKDSLSHHKKQDYKNYSFTWQSDNINEIKKLYNSLIENQLIECSEAIFIKAFTNKELDVNEFIVWSDKGKNKKVNKQSLIFLLKRLYISKIKHPGVDENRLIESVFRDYNQNPIKHIKVSKSNIDSSETKGVYGRIRTIVDSL